MIRFTESEAERLGELGAKRASLRSAQPKPARKRDKSGEDRLAFELRQIGVPFVTQFELAKRVQIPRRDGRKTERVWRFDAALPEHKLLIEVDGGVWTRGAHGHPVDIMRNMAKRNDAAIAGYHVISFTPQQVKSRAATAGVMAFLAGRGWKP